MSSSFARSEDGDGIAPKEIAASKSAETLLPTPTPTDNAVESRTASKPRNSNLLDVDLSYRAPPAIAWRSQPLWDTASENWMFPLFVFTLGWLTFRATTSLATTVFVAAVFLATSRRAWFPTNWEVSREGVVRRRLGVAKKWSWRKFAAYQIDRRGVLLFEIQNPRPWHYLRGVHVPWSPHQDQLLAIVAHYMGPPTGEKVD